MGTQAKKAGCKDFDQSCQEVDNQPSALSEWVAYRRAHPIVIRIPERSLRISALVVAAVLGTVMSLDIQGAIQVSEPSWTLLNAAFATALYIPLQRATAATAVK
jgi:hypothetical protein